MTDDDQPGRPGIWTELAPTLAWMVLFSVVCVMAFLVLYPPRPSFEGATSETGSDTVCLSVVQAGWPLADGSDVGDGVEDVGPAFDDDVAAVCQARRTFAAAATAILALPGALIGCWLMVSRQRRRTTNEGHR